MLRTVDQKVDVRPLARVRGVLADIDPYEAQAPHPCPVGREFEQLPQRRPGLGVEQAHDAPVHGPMPIERDARKIRMVYGRDDPLALVGGQRMGDATASVSRTPQTVSFRYFIVTGASGDPTLVQALASKPGRITKTPVGALRQSQMDLDGVQTEPVPLPPVVYYMCVGFPDQQAARFGVASVDFAHCMGPLE